MPQSTSAITVRIILDPLNACGPENNSLSTPSSSLLSFRQTGRSLPYFKIHNPETIKAIPIISRIIMLFSQSSIKTAASETERFAVQTYLLCRQTPNTKAASDTTSSETEWFSVCVWFSRSIWSGDYNYIWHHLSKSISNTSLTTRHTSLK